MAIWDLNWDPTRSMKGGETGPDGEFTEAGKNDFFAPFWSSRSKDEWSKFLKGDYEWHDYLNPGGVMANPAQQIADPGNFFTSQEHRNWADGDVSDRTAMSGLMAGLVWGGAGAPGLSNLGIGGSSAGGGSAVGDIAPATSADWIGGTSALTEGGAAGAPWWQKLLGGMGLGGVGGGEGTNDWGQFLGMLGGGQQPQQAPPAQPAQSARPPVQISPGLLEMLRGKPTGLSESLS